MSNIHDALRANRAQPGASSFADFPLDTPEVQKVPDSSLQQYEGCFSAWRRSNPLPQKVFVHDAPEDASPA